MEGVYAYTTIKLQCAAERLFDADMYAAVQVMHSVLDGSQPKQNPT